MLNAQQIMEIIPHRYPFLLIDSAELSEDGCSAISYKNLSVNEYFFQGHFPQEPIMPGVLLIEAIAQTGVLVILSQQEHKGRMVYLGGIKSARFRKKLYPGDVLRIEFNITSYSGKIGFGRGVVRSADVVVCDTELTFVIG